MPFPKVDQFYWLLEPYAIDSLKVDDISATEQVDIFQADFGGVSPLFSSDNGLHAPDGELLVLGMFVGATILIEVPEASTLSLGVIAFFGAAQAMSRWRR
jgi:hypothetical protein